MTDRYDIHNGAMEAGQPDSYGAEANQGEPDTTLPPAGPSSVGQKGNRAYPGEPGYEGSSSGEIASGEHTRVPTPTGVNSEAAPKAQ